MFTELLSHDRRTLLRATAQEMGERRASESGASRGRCPHGLRAWRGRRVPAGSGLRPHSTRVGQLLTHVLRACPRVPKAPMVTQDTLVGIWGLQGQVANGNPSFGMQYTWDFLLCCSCLSHERRALNRDAAMSPTGTFPALSGSAFCHSFDEIIGWSP